MPELLCASNWDRRTANSDSDRYDFTMKFLAIVPGHIRSSNFISSSARTSGPEDFWYENLTVLTSPKVTKYLAHYA